VNVILLRNLQGPSEAGVRYEVETVSRSRILEKPLLRNHWREMGEGTIGRWSSYKRKTPHHDPTMKVRKGNDFHKRRDRRGRERDCIRTTGLYSKIPDEKDLGGTGDLWETLNEGSG